MSNQDTLGGDLIPSTIIKVNPNPTYPVWFKKPIHPELQDIGPMEYDLGAVKQWRHERQKSGWTAGTNIYNHLVNTSSLNLCLGMRDLLAIQGAGVNVFQMYFGHLPSYGFVCGWKGVFLDGDNRPRVPYLKKVDAGIHLCSVLVSTFIGGGCPGLRYPNS